MDKKLSLGRFVSTFAAAVLLGINTLSAVSASELIDDCNYCHGQNGVSTEPTVPTIAGMSDFFITESFAVYKDRDRPCVEAEYLDGPDKGSKTDMCKIADKLGDAEIEESAKYYAGQQYVRAQQDFDPARAKLGAEVHDNACARCHEDGGSVAEDDAGFLAGQWTPYLRQVFAAYDAGTHSMPKKMQPRYEALSAEDKENLLHYYGSLQ